MVLSWADTWTWPRCGFFSENAITLSSISLSVRFLWWWSGRNVRFRAWGPFSLSSLRFLYMVWRETPLIRAASVTFCNFLPTQLHRLSSVFPNQTWIVNHAATNAKIIGTNEHESHYIFDLLYNNTCEIKPRVFSTDTRGVNHVNFALLDLFGYSFAPRYAQPGRIIVSLKERKTTQALLVRKLSTY